MNAATEYAQRTLTNDMKMVADDLSFQQRRLAELEAESIAKLTRRGMAMIHLPDSDVKIIIDKVYIDLIVNHATFVFSSKEEGDTSNSSGVLTPFAGQLNVTYFTGD